MIERWLGPPWMWLGLYGIVLGFSLWFSAPARPDPVGAPGQGDWAAVCGTLDALPFLSSRRDRTYDINAIPPIPLPRNTKHKGGHMATHYLTAEELEEMTGTPASTFRYWASIGEGPPSLKLGRRRVWKRDQVEKWLAKREATR